MKSWRQLLGKQNSIQSMEKSGVTSTEEGKANEKQHQVNVDFFLWSEGNCSQRICGQTVNAAFYVEVLKCLRENVRRKRPDQWWNNTWLLHHDNAQASAALLTRMFLTDNNLTVVPHPPYSPDRERSDFFLFPKLKMKLKERRFQTLEEIQDSRRPSWTRYEKMTPKNASKTGSAAGIVVKSQKGTTLKVMPAPKVWGKPFCVLSHQSENLLTNPRSHLVILSSIQSFGRSLIRSVSWPFRKLVSQLYSHLGSESVMWVVSHSVSWLVSQLSTKSVI